MLINRFLAHLRLGLLVLCTSVVLLLFVTAASVAIQLLPLGSRFDPLPGIAMAVLEIILKHKFGR